jgi:hypothetical protein
MVKFGWSPTSRIVAGSAIRSQASLVGILGGVAGIAILWCRFKFLNGVGIEMTLATQYLGMFTRQLEWDFIVDEFMPIRIHPIMTDQAGRSKVLLMHLHE